MESLSYRTISANKNTVNKEWVLIDAKNEVVGRVASTAAKFLRGKYKTNYTPHVDCGDNVIIINADKAVFTGKKFEVKEYMRYTGYPGGERFETPKTLVRKNFTERILEHAIKGMLPKNRLGRQLYRNLKVYTGTEHPHEAQQPKVINIHEIK